MRKIFIILLLAVLPSSLKTQWVQLTSPTSGTLYCLYFSDPSTGFIGGSLNGAIYKTIDGGASWNILTVDSNSSFYDMYFTDPQTGFIGGSSKQIFMTTDEGATWIVKTSGTGTINSMSFYTTSALAVGNNPNVIDLSTDLGENWAPLTPPTSDPLKGCWLSTLTYGWICGENGNIWKTINGGQTWIDQVQASTYNFEKIRFFGLFAGYAIGSGGTLLKSSNGGTDWFEITSGVSGTLYDIYLYNSASGWVVGENGAAVRTTNGGGNWHVQPTPVTSTLYAIHMVTHLTGYIVGSDGVILKTTTGGNPIGIIPNSYPVKYELRQNYPNPFNPATSIEYSIIKTSAVKLSVYDLAGRLAKVLVDDIESPGSYRVAFDGTNFPSGVYICRLETDEYRGLIKMVLIK